MKKIKDTYKDGFPEVKVDTTQKQIKRTLEKIVEAQQQQNEELIQSLNDNFDLLTKELTKITQDSSQEGNLLKAQVYENVLSLQTKLINTIEANKLELPDELKVQVSNQPTIEKIAFPKVQDVKITNPVKVQKVELTNPAKDPQKLPINKGNSPKTADPSIYIPVRLTNGERFYNALQDAYVAAGQKTFPFVNFKSGKPQAASVDDDGVLRTDLVVEGIALTISGVTTVSGSQTDVKNWPTVQTVAVKSMPEITAMIDLSGQTLAVSGVVMSASGTQHAIVDNWPTIQSVNVLNQRTLASGVDSLLVANFPTIQTVQDNSLTISGSQHSVIDNWPTVQSVSVKDMPQVNVDLRLDDVTLAVSGTVTTLSGSKTDVQNWPTIQTVNVQNLTTISGQQNFHVDNWPTYQSVNVANIVPLTSISGTLHSVVDNWPTIQTVRDTSLTISGSQRNLIDNFPTVQKVSIQDMPTVTAQLISNGTTMAVSGTVTTISGSQTDIKNWPTYQTVNVANIVPLTSLSGTLHAVVDNFPTFQSVNITNSVTYRHEDDPHTSGDFGTFMLGVRNDAGTALTSTDLDYSPIAVDSAGRIKESPSTTALANGAETTVAGSAVQVLAANTARKGMILQNTGVANARVGITGVTTTTGFRLVPGGTVTFTAPFIPTDAIFAIREGAVSTTLLAQEIT